MYEKHSKYITEMLKDYKAGKISELLMLQGIQNIIGEEIERCDVIDRYAVIEK